MNRAPTCVPSQGMGTPRDNKDASQDLARDLADIAEQLASLKGEAKAWLRDSNYNTLKLSGWRAHTRQ